MAVAKHLAHGSLSFDCYALLIELCDAECWTEAPFSTFPLECDGVGDAVLMSIVNLAVFSLALCAATPLVLCGNCLCMRCQWRGHQMPPSQRSYKRLRESGRLMQVPMVELDLAQRDDNV